MICSDRRLRLPHPHRRSPAPPPAPPDRPPRRPPTNRRPGQSQSRSVGLPCFKFAASLWIFRWCACTSRSPASAVEFRDGTGLCIQDGRRTVDRSGCFLLDRHGHLRLVGRICPASGTEQLGRAVSSCGTGFVFTGAIVKHWPISRRTISGGVGRRLPLPREGPRGRRLERARARRAPGTIVAKAFARAPPARARDHMWFVGPRRLLLSTPPRRHRGMKGGLGKRGNHTMIKTALLHARPSTRPRPFRGRYPARPYHQSPAPALLHAPGSARPRCALSAARVLFPSLAGRSPVDH